MFDCPPHSENYDAFNGGMCRWCGETSDPCEACEDLSIEAGIQCYCEEHEEEVQT